MWENNQVTNTPNTANAIDQVGKGAALLSAVEVGLGSLLHTLRLPFSGHFLSLNQGFILTRLTKVSQQVPGSQWSAFQLSAITALLKSLAPAGKKLTPMLAISVQGLLFNLPTLVLGKNLLGVIFGYLVLSIWAFIQPLLIYLLLFGRTLVDVAAYYLEKLEENLVVSPESLLKVLLTMVAIKCFIAVVLAVLSWRVSEDWERHYLQKLTKLGKERRRKAVSVQAEDYNKIAAARLALRDLFHPLFLLSMLLTALFFIFSESSLSNLIWALLRPLAIGFLIFYMIRLFSFEDLATKMTDWGMSPTFAQSFKNAIKAIKEV